MKDTTDAKAKAAEEGVTFTQVALTNEMTAEENEMTAEENEMTAEEKADQAAQAKWLHSSNENPVKKAVLTLLVFYCLWVFLLTLGVMGTGFKLLGGKDSAKMFDVVGQPYLRADDRYPRHRACAVLVHHHVHHGLPRRC